MTEPTASSPPRVIIVGAGLAGLMTGILLGRAGIPFAIYERAKEVKPIGSTMAFNANILPVFEQLGLLEEAQKISLPCRGLSIYGSDRKLMGGFDLSTYEERTGYNMILFSRPIMYQLFLNQISSERLHFNKKIVSIAQDENGVRIICEDGTTAQGDILVGADGAYSRVRQSLYEELAKESLLPESDKEQLTVGHVCMVGTTRELAKDRYEALGEPYSRFERIMMQGTSHSWSAATIPGNRVAWLMTTQLKTSSNASQDKNIEWGPAANEAMINEVRDYPCPLGGTMGELIEMTPKDMISRVFLEEKLFETWAHGRTVLIGDGAINALQDAVILVNSIVDMPSASAENIKIAFQEFREERYPHVKYQMDKAKIMATIQYGQTWKDRAIRYAIFNLIPKWIQTEQYLKDANNRPQVSFLPQVPNRGTIPVLPQKIPKRLKQEQ
ncbi:hypothetical protein BGZ83_001454 [Gryganskiella cystojenkinii]|nr:hypothetical protein BGZ83_001454 [Gryganskiella cystojenkinii]